MIRLPKLKRLNQGLIIGCLLCILLMLVNVNVYGITEHKVEESRSTHEVGRGSEYNRNIDLQAIKYPIYIHWEFKKTDEQGDFISDPWFMINISQNGSITKSLLLARGTGSYSGELEIPANSSLDVKVGVGERDSWKHLKHRYFGHGYYYKISYVLDEAAPDKPGPLRVKPGNGKVVTIDGKVYTNNDDVVLTWDKVADHKTEFEGHQLGVDWASLYLLNIHSTTVSDFIGYDIAQTTNTQLRLFDIDLGGWVTDIPYKMLNFNKEGTYQIKLKARDYDENESEYSDPITLVIDRSVGIVNLPDNPVTTNGSNLYFTWNPSDDEVGIQEYQVGITTANQAPTGTQIISVGKITNATFPSLTKNQSYYVWERAVDLLGNIGEWKSSGPYALSPSENVTISAVPTATLDSNKQPVYRVTLTVSNIEATSYIIERQTEGSTTRQTVANLTYAQMAQNKFMFTDSTGLSKHGRYIYYIHTQNANGENSESSNTGVVEIPNIAAEFSVVGPAHQLATQNKTHTFDIAPKTDYGGDILKFRVWYKLKDGQAKVSGDYQSDPISITFPSDGTYDWWMEVGEFSGVQLITKSTGYKTSTRSLIIQPAPASVGVNLPVLFETTPGQVLQLKATVNGITNPTYSWTPGDGGAQLTGATPTYTYNHLGSFTLTLTVTDDFGKTYTATSVVQVCNTTSGTIQTNQTWSGAYTVSGDVTVGSGVTLTIQPGTTITVEPGSSLRVDGNLQANDPNKGIVIQAPGASEWQGMMINSSGPVVINGVTIQGAKTGIVCNGAGTVSISNTTIQNCTTALHCYSGSINVTATTFKDNKIYGVKEDNECSPKLTNCSFENNGINYYDEQLLYVSVGQLNTGGNSGNTYTISGMGAPVITKISSGNNQVELNWDSVINSVGYKVKYGTKTGEYTQVVYVKNATNVTITGLKKYIRYYFVVAAASSSGAENNSSEKSIVIGPIKAPVLNNIEYGIQEIRLSWDKVANATGYIIKYGTSSGIYTKSIELGDIDEFVVSNLNKYVNYYFVITAMFNQVESENSNEKSEMPGIIPKAPKISSIASGDTSVTLTWSKTEDASGYLIKYGTSSSSYTNTVQTTDVTSYTASGLFPFTIYYFVVSAINKRGESINSSEQTIMIGTGHILAEKNQADAEDNTNQTYTEEVATLKNLNYPTRIKWDFNVWYGTSFTKNLDSAWLKVIITKPDGTNLEQVLACLQGCNSSSGEFEVPENAKITILANTGRYSYSRSHIALLYNYYGYGFHYKFTFINTHSL